MRRSEHTLKRGFGARFSLFFGVIRVVEAALPAQAYKDLGLKPDDRVFIRLRNTRFFDEDFSI